ncbi:MAG: DUF1840 domain-containing protein [Gammaproteobacteria bacterium]|nr:DUF1840 domain-containing protein [Gammaproteobacteria bacterium]
MLITFHTDAYESITMFGDVAKHMLTLMGQSGAVPGAILAPGVADALAQLRKAVEREKQQPGSNQAVEDDEPAVSMAHRAVPLIALLEAAVEKHCDVLWSVGT